MAYEKSPNLNNAPLLRIPREIVTERILAYLKKNDARNLWKSHSSFFKDSQIRKKIKEIPLECLIALGGDGHAMVYESKNNLLYGCGNNGSGQLGLGNNQNQYIWQPIPLPKNKSIQQIIAGNDYTFLLFEDGSLYSCGCNSSGQLALGHTKQQMTWQPVHLPEDKSVKQIIVGRGRSSTFLLCQDNSLYGCGDNYYGQLGFAGGGKQDQPTWQPIPLPENKSIQQIITGDDSTFLLCQDNSLYSCGDHHYNGHYRPARYYGELAFRDKQPQHTWEPIPLPENKSIQQIITGDKSTFLLYQDGSLYAYGNNKRGQLGLGHNQDQKTWQFIPLPKGQHIQQIAVGRGYSLLLCQDGSLYGSGGDLFGHLVLGRDRDQNTWQCIPLQKIKPIQQIIAGALDTFLLCQDGSFYGCGINHEGQLGLGHNQAQKTWQLITPQNKPTEKVIIQKEPSVRFLHC